GEAAGAGLDKARRRALLFDLARDRSVQRRGWSQALGRRPVALGRHLGDQLGTAQRLAGFAQHQGGRVEGTGLLGRGRRAFGRRRRLSGGGWPLLSRSGCGGRDTLLLGWHGLTPGAKALGSKRHARRAAIPGQEDYLERAATSRQFHSEFRSFSLLRQ